MGLEEMRVVVAGGSTTTTTIDWCGDLVLEKVGSAARAARRLRLDGDYYPPRWAAPDRG